MPIHAGTLLEHILFCAGGKTQDRIVYKRRSRLNRHNFVAYGLNPWQEHIQNVVG